MISEDVVRRALTNVLREIYYIDITDDDLGRVMNHKAMEKTGSDSDYIIKRLTEELNEVIK